LRRITDYAAGRGDDDSFAERRLAARRLRRCRTAATLLPSDRTHDETPAVFYRLTDNWLELTMRFIAPTHGVREL
jgi:hypothetical protein